jgi:hypothetical protein
LFVRLTSIGVRGRIAIERCAAARCIDARGRSSAAAVRILISVQIVDRALIVQPLKIIVTDRICALHYQHAPIVEAAEHRAKASALTGPRGFMLIAGNPLLTPSYLHGESADEEDPRATQSVDGKRFHARRSTQSGKQAFS